MHAIVEIAGKQMKVTADTFVYTHQLPQAVGEEVMLDKVLLIQEETGILLGAPLLTGAKVIAKVLAHKRGDKVLVFKKKRRKGYKKTQGHRQAYTQLYIENIIKP